MIRRIIFAILITFNCTAFAQKNDNPIYPVYDVVVTTFFDSYSTDDIPSDQLIKFQKKPDGWHMTTSNETATDTTTRDELFWSKEKNKFQKLSIEELTKKKTDNYSVNRDLLAKALQIWDKRNFSLSPYYGYPGWDSDVINDFKDKTNLPDSTLYALGRAYASYGENLLNSNMGYASSKTQFQLPDGQNCLTPEQLETYRKYEHAAIDTYGKVKEKDPNFETLVGSIDTKFANEHVTAFLDLRMYQNEEEAKKELVPGLYNDFTRSLAKNILSSCAKNAILFTFGDGDTYPLLYEQAQYGVRTDVLVVNVSLLQTSRYINSLRNKILDADPLPISFSPEQIKGTKREVIIINSDEEKNKYVELSKMISFIANDENVKSYSAGGPDYSFINTNKFQLTTPKNTLKWQTTSSYFLRSDLMIYNIIATTKFDRPVYFSATGGNDAYLNLNDYLQLEGIAYKLTDAAKKRSPEQEFADPNRPAMWYHLMTGFDWKGMSTITSNEKTIAAVYRHSFQTLFDELMERNKTDSAKLVLNKYMEVMPNSAIHFDVYTIAVIEGYYKLEDFEKGNAIAETLIYNIKNNIDNYEGLTYSSNTKGWQKDTADRLTYLLKEYKQNKLLKELAQIY